MNARDPDDDVEISRCTAQLRSYIADLEHDLARSRELRADAVASAGDAIAEREKSNRERDACARELAAVLAERDAPPARQSPDGLDLARRAVSLWGITAQMSQAIEESAELIVAIRHRLRGRDDSPGYAKVADEVIDVEWMCKQLRVIIGSNVMVAAESRKMAKVVRKVTEAEAKRDGEVTQ